MGLIFIIIISISTGAVGGSLHFTCRKVVTSDRDVWKVHANNQKNNNSLSAGTMQNPWWTFELWTFSVFTARRYASDVCAWHEVENYWPLRGTSFMGCYAESA